MWFFLLVLLVGPGGGQTGTNQKMPEAPRKHTQYLRALFIFPHCFNYDSCFFKPATSTLAVERRRRQRAYKCVISQCAQSAFINNLLLSQRRQELLVERNGFRRVKEGEG